MNEFIHTFSVTRCFSEQEYMDFKNAYGLKFFYNSDKHRFVLSKYADNGIRVEIIKREDKERKYDSLHRKYKATIIITPHKLLTPGKHMGKLTSGSDIEAACKQLESIISVIENESGLNLWQDVKLRRVDITKDVVTPSDLYSAEIIKASKQAVYKNGYKKLYLKMVNASEDAIRILIAAQQECEEIIISNENNTPDRKVIPLSQEDRT